MTSIDEVVLGVPGVRGVYPSTPELLEAAVAITDRLRRTDHQPRTVHVRIGIDDTEGSHVVCERVCAALLEHLRESEPLLEPRIEVTVVAIG
jgi:hypothetical protein